MRKKYMLVEILKNKIIEIKTVVHSKRREVLINKNPNQQLWSVKSYKDAREQINNYNNNFKLSIKGTESNDNNNSPVSTDIKIWNKKKITEKMLKKLFNLYDNKKYGEIMVIHNDNKLSEDFYCCTNYNKHIDYNINLLK